MNIVLYVTNQILIHIFPQKTTFLHRKTLSLYNANFAGANFEVANLESANLIEADLSDTNISGANLKSANLTSAKNLTKEQIESAVTDDNTKLPDYLI